MAKSFEKSLVSYLDPLSAQAGDTLSLRVSCETESEYDVQLVRLISGDDRPHGTGFAEVELDGSLNGTYAGECRPLQPGSYARLPDLPVLQDLTVVVGVYPTTPLGVDQCLISHPSFRLMIVDGWLVADLNGHIVRSGIHMHARRWHIVSFSRSGEKSELSVTRFGLGSGEQDVTDRVASDTGRTQLANADWLLAAQTCDGMPKPGFNGRLEAPGIFASAIEASAATELYRKGGFANDANVVGAWDFSVDMHTDTLIDITEHARHGRVFQQPVRAVKGMLWDGSVQRFADTPEQYGAIHFHEDDLVDAGWPADLEWRVPADLPSGVYALRLRQGASEDYSPFFVRPGAGAVRADLALLMPTATYLAYANQRLALTDGPFGNSRIRNANDAYLLEHEEVGNSLYEHHRDRSGVHFSSYHRPVLNLKPKGGTWAFNADLNLVAWLTAIDQPFDVITDEDLHQEGPELLGSYRSVITGTHPEYYTSAMLDGLQTWLDQGGRLMYMGGNGFYWRIAYHPEDSGIIEVRRAEDGTRAWIAEHGEYYHAFSGEYGGLWRRLGRAPNQMVGIGFAAQGFDGGTYYRLQPGALDKRAAFIMEGVTDQETLGAHGTQGGGAAGEEIDRFDAALGSPAHAIVIASSENHRPGMLRVKEELHMNEPAKDDPNIRADITFFETPSGGAVFSTGSISYAGSLSTDAYDNDIARLTGNVLRRFLDPEPFDLPPSV